jgi:hypothetical protein
MRLQIERSRWWRGALAAGAVLAALLAACGGDGGDVTPTPPGARSTVFPVPPGMATVTPLPPPERTSYRFLYSEFGMDEDIIWSIDAADPSDRVEVAKVPHKPGSAVVAALSPDGKKIAYNAMPELGSDSTRDAETYILDLESEETRLVAEGVDLLAVPRWSPDGGLLFLRRNLEEEVTVILVDVSQPDDEDEDGEQEGDGEEEKPPPIRTVLRQHVSDVLVYVPLGFDAEEATMYFIQVQGGTERGTYLGRYAPATGEAVATATAEAEATATATAEALATATGGTPTPTPTPAPTPTPTPVASPTPTPRPVLTGSVFLFLSDQTAQDYSLSPDSSRVVFLVPSLVGGEFVFRTLVADIKTEQVSPLTAEGLPAGQHLRPLWHPDGDKVSVGRLPAGPNAGRIALVPLDGGEVTFLPPPHKGFDIPLSWSPDGKFLAVKSFLGESLANSGPERLVFVAQGGQRLPAPEGAETRPVGWLEAE